MSRVLLACGGTGGHLAPGIALDFDVDCVGLEKPELGEYGDELPGEQSYLPPRDDL